MLMLGPVLPLAHLTNHIGQVWENRSIYAMDTIGDAVTERSRWVHSGPMG